MQLKCDYTAKYWEKMKRLDQEIDMPLTGKEQEVLEQLELLLKLQEIRKARYRSFNTALRDQLINEFYPFLREMAERSGARVELNVDEEEMNARIYYACYGGIFLNDCDTFPGLSEVKKILAASDDVVISTETDGQIKIALNFSLYDREAVEKLLGKLPR